MICGHCKDPNATLAHVRECGHSPARHPAPPVQRPRGNGRSRAFEAAGQPYRTLAQEIEADVAARRAPRSYGHTPLAAQRQDEAAARRRSAPRTEVADGTWALRHDSDGIVRVYTVETGKGRWSGWRFITEITHGEGRKVQDRAEKRRLLDEIGARGIPCDA